MQSLYYRIVRDHWGNTSSLHAETSSLDLEQANLDKLVSSLEEDGFGTYLTSVGGSGLGVLSPYNDDSESRLDDGPVTPPETPAFGGSPGDGDGVGLHQSRRAVFERKSSADLVEWMESRGRWLYV